MKPILVATLAIMLGGCALFGKPAPTSASVAPALNQPALVGFMPAFGAGAPVALVPCRTASTLDSKCRRVNIAHERRGDMPAGETEEPFNDGTTISLKRK